MASISELNELELADLAIDSWARSIKSRGIRYSPEPTTSDPGETRAYLTMATPDRAFASTGPLHGVDDSGRDQIRLPALAFERGSPVFDTVRWSGTRVRRVSYSDDRARVSQVDFPLPYNIPYTFEIWTGKRTMMNEFVRSYVTSLSPLTWLTINYGDEIGSKYSKLMLESVTDNTNLEPADKDVTYRTSLSVNLEMLFFKKIADVPTVRSWTIEVYEEGAPSGSDPLDTYRGPSS